MGLFIVLGLGVFISILIFVVAFYAKIWNWIFDKIAAYRFRKAKIRAINKRQRDLKNRT